MSDAYRSLVEHSIDALSWHAPDGTFRYVSPGFTELLGWREDEVVGLAPTTLLHPQDVTQVGRTYRDLKGTGGSFRLTFRIRRADHTYIWVESTGRVVAGSQASTVVATRDIEVRRSLLETLEYEQRVRQQLTELAEQQRHFVTAVAHRARNPMTAVLGFAHTLRRSAGELDEERRRHLIERLAANAESLAEVIQQATELDRIAGAEDPIRRETCDLVQLIEAALAQIAEDAAPIMLDLDAEATTVQADPARIDRALRALLRNAISHTLIRTPIVIRTRRSGDGVTITVEDRGPGVRAEIREAIFEPFVKGDSYLPHDPGLGLGLSLVARIAAEHGGRAWVTDGEDGGAAFHLTIADEPRPAPVAPSRTLGAGHDRPCPDRSFQVAGN